MNPIFTVLVQAVNPSLAPHQGAKHRALTAWLSTALLLAASGLSINATVKAAPAMQTSQQVAPQTIHIHRALAKDSLRSIRYQYLEQPTSEATKSILLAANTPATQAALLSGKPLAAGLPIHIPSSIMMQKNTPAVISLLQGEVSLQNAKQENLPDSTRSLEEGGRIKIGKNGLAVLTFADASKMELLPGTTLVLKTLKQLVHTDIHYIDLQLVEGRIEAAVNPKRALASRFNLESRRTVTGVRGTVFRASDSAGDGGENAVVEVTKGEIAYSAMQNSVAVGAGKGSFLQATGPSEPIPLLAAPTWQGGDSPMTIDQVLPLKLPPGAQKVFLSATADQANGATQVFYFDAATPWKVPPTLNSTHYRLVMRAIDQNGLQGESLAQTLLLLKAPFPPTKLEISANKLQWNSVKAAMLYRLEIYAETTSDAPLVQIVTPYQSISLLDLPAGNYRARVASVASANNSIDSGSFGAWFQFNKP